MEVNDFIVDLGYLDMSIERLWVGYLWYVGT